MEAGDLASALKIEPTSELATLGAIVQGEDSIDSIYALGAKNGMAFALVPGLREESESFYSLLAEGREIGLFSSDFETASASVSIFDGFNPKSKWVVVGGELGEDSERKFGNPHSVSDDDYSFHDLDLEPWNDLYRFVGESPDPVEMKLA